MVTGKVSVRLDSSKVILKKGESITIPIGAVHRITGIDDSTILEIAFGEFDENDIIRLEDDFGRSKRGAKRNHVTTESQSPTTDTTNNDDIQTHLRVKFSTDKASMIEMIRSCKEEENVERRLDIIRKINALFPEKQRLLIPSLITIHYIDHALSVLEEKILADA